MTIPGDKTQRGWRESRIQRSWDPLVHLNFGTRLLIGYPHTSTRGSWAGWQGLSDRFRKGWGRVRERTPEGLVCCISAGSQGSEAHSSWGWRARSLAWGWLAEAPAAGWRPETNAEKQSWDGPNQTEERRQGMTKSLLSVLCVTSPDFSNKCHPGKENRKGFPRLDCGDPEKHRAPS